MTMSPAVLTDEIDDSQFSRALDRLEGECELDPEAAVARFQSAL
jgi:hypothetical protein